MIHDACKDIGLAVGVSAEVLFVIKMTSQVTLAQLRNESRPLQIDSTMPVICVMGQVCTQHL